MSSRVIERSTGAQILPDVRDERAGISAWQAHLCCDADMRVKASVFNSIAEEMEVRTDGDDR